MKEKLYKEFFAGVIVILTLSMFFTPQVYEIINPQPANTILINASIAESGGFDPGTIYLKVNETVSLKIYSMDVTHSFLIPSLGIETEPLHAGDSVTIDVTFDSPGEYYFRCTIKCSPEHRFMYGTIVVTE